VLGLGLLVALASAAAPALGEPPGPAQDASGPASSRAITPVSDGAAAAPSETAPAAPDDALPAGPIWGPWSFLGAEIQPGERRALELSLGNAGAAADSALPVTVVRGVAPGPTLCLTAAVHGDEINGIEIVGRVSSLTQPETLRGTLVGIPIVNLPGFRRGSRYMPDRRDLNRFFPGNARGSAASRFAHNFFERVVRHCDALVDFHSGSFHRTNLPQVRGDLTQPRVLALAIAFGAPVILNNSGGRGTLRHAALDVGIPAILYEAGEPMRLHDEEVERGIAGVRGLLRGLDMVESDGPGPIALPPIYDASRWVRADSVGILRANVLLGSEVQEGDVLATVFDPIADVREEIRSPVAGRVIGKALDQFVAPGFAVFHLAEARGGSLQAPGTEPPEDEDLDTEGGARPGVAEPDERPE